MQKKVILIVSGGLLVVAAAVLILHIVLRSSSPIPVSIKKQLNFVPFLPVTSSSVIVTKPYSIEYDSSNQVLSYKLQFGGNLIVFSEQPTPQSFNDVPNVYTQLIVKLRGQNSFSTPSGTVNITYPIEYKGLQTAVMNSQGVLLFARPDKNISTNQWTKLFNNLVTSR